MSRLSGNKRAVAIVLGVVLVLLVVLIAATSGFGDDSPSGDAVAVVDGEEISQEDFDRALGQAAARQGAAKNCQGPSPDDPQFATLRDEALNDILDQAWILGEAAEQGVEASDREVEEEFQTTREQNFKTEKEYEDFLKQSCFTQEDVDERVRLQVISTKIQEDITANAGDVSEDDARKFYEANEEQFAQPETRNIRIVLNEDPEKAQQAADQLEQDNSPESWKKVAAEFSTDASSKDAGGVRESITEGVFPEAVDAQIFDAPEGEVVGPIETDAGTYVFQVDSINEATTTPFDEARGPDRRAARRPAPAGAVQRLPQRLSRPLGGADRLRRRLRDRALRQLRRRDPALPRPEPPRGAAEAAARADRLPAARALHQPRGPRILPTLHARQRAAAAPPPAR